MDAENVKGKIKEVLADNHVTANNLAKTFGVNQKTLHNQINDTATISVSTIILLSKRFPTLSMEWLLRGVGDMYLSSNSVENSNNNAEENYLKETIELLKSNIEDLKETIAAQRETIIAQRNENALLKKETDYIQENHIVCAAHSAKPHIV